MDMFSCYGIKLQWLLPHAQNWETTRSYTILSGKGNKAPNVHSRKMALASIKEAGEIKKGPIKLQQVNVKTPSAYILTPCTLTSVCKLSKLYSIHFRRRWKGEFVEQLRASLVGDQFLYSCNLNVWFGDNCVKEKLGAYHSQGFIGLSAYSIKRSTLIKIDIPVNKTNGRYLDYKLRSFRFFLISPVIQ